MRVQLILTQCHRCQCELQYKTPNQETIETNCKHNMAGLDDGWGEDDDLAMSEEGDGWGEDEDLFDDEERESGTNLVADVQHPPESEQQTIVAKDGWDDSDLAGFGDEWDYDDGDNDKVQTMEQQMAESSPEHRVGITAGADGVLRNDHDGWSDDEDAFEKGIGDHGIQHRGANPKVEGLAIELESYVRSLSHMHTSINAILEFEYNTPEKAYELQEYYASRANLAEYTRTKELERMEYQVLLPHGHLETNKAQIAEFLPDSSLISRCSNQSLLADLLQVMTGSDLLVRPQYLASCFAHWCQFKIHLGGERGDMVHCQTKLQLSLPTSSGPRLTIAELSAMVVFIPNQPMVEYQLNSIDVLLAEQDYPKLSGTAEFLSMIEGHFNEYADQQQAISGNFRDNFVENSQKFLSQSSAGMKSALQQMESVVNIQQKLNLFSKLLPDTEDVLAAEEEAMAYAAQEQQQNILQFPRPPPLPTSSREHPSQRRPPPPHNHGNSHGFPRPPQSESQNHPPPPPPPAQHAQGPDRPQSILGGLMRSGFSRLAQTVTLPEDQDPAIYGATGQPQTGQPPHVYRPEPPFHSTTLNLEQNKSSSKEGSPIPLQTRPPAPPQLGHTEPQPHMKTEPPTNHFKKSGPVDIVQLAACDKTETINAPNPKLPTGEQRFTDANLQDPGQEGPSSPVGTAKEHLAPLESKEIVREEIEDGWGSYDVEDDSIEEAVDEAFPATNKHNPSQPQSPTLHDEQPAPSSCLQPRPARELVVNVEYNPDKDIIATRKRWINPRPHRPHLYL